jgi:hypothetical protein
VGTIGGVKGTEFRCPICGTHLIRVELAREEPRDLNPLGAWRRVCLALRAHLFRARDCAVVLDRQLLASGYKVPT